MRNEGSAVDEYDPDINKEMPPDKECICIHHKYLQKLLIAAGLATIWLLLPHDLECGFH